MIKEAIIKLSNKQDIGYNMAKVAMNDCFSRRNEKSLYKAFT